MNNRITSETTISRDQIALMAYEVWEKAGRPHGRDWEFWFEAERQLLGAIKQVAVAPQPRSILAPVSMRTTTVPPVARMEPARVQPAPTKPPRKGDRKSPGTMRGGKGRA